QTEPTWLRPSAQQERTTAKSSTHPARCGSQSLTSIPDSPYFLNVLLLARSVLPPVPIGVITVPKLAGSFWPCSRVNSGLGSNVSRWLGPPSMNRKITAFALAFKGGSLGTSGLAVGFTASASPSRPSWYSRQERANAPKPPPALSKKSRRERSRGT